MPHSKFLLRLNCVLSYIGILHALTLPHPHTLELIHAHTRTQVKYTTPHTHTHTWRANAAAPTCVMFPSVLMLFDIYLVQFSLCAYFYQSDTERQRYFLIKSSFRSMSSHTILVQILTSNQHSTQFCVLSFSLTYLLSICFSACYVTTKKKRKQQHDLKCYPRTQRVACSCKAKTITERELAMLTGNYDVIVLYRYRYRYFDICADIRALDIHIALISKCNLVEKKHIAIPIVAHTNRQQAAHLPVNSLAAHFDAANLNSY